MKNKKILIIISCIVLLLIGVVIALILTNKEEKTTHNIIEVRFSYGGGFGTEIDTASKIFTFTKDGKLILTNSYDSHKEEIEFGKDKYEDLCEVINDNYSIFEKKVKEDNDVMDGGSSYIYIKLEDGKEYEVGGYMVRNEEFNNIKTKIFELVDKDVINEYKKNIGK